MQSFIAFVFYSNWDCARLKCKIYLTYYAFWHEIHRCFFVHKYIRDCISFSCVWWDYHHCSSVEIIVFSLLFEIFDWDFNHINFFQSFWFIQDIEWDDFCLFLLCSKIRFQSQCIDHISSKSWSHSCKLHDRHVYCSILKKWWRVEEILWFHISRFSRLRFRFSWSLCLIFTRSWFWLLNYWDCFTSLIRCLKFSFFCSSFLTHHNLFHSFLFS